ncbi:hypothetical protein PIB30_075058 [Stylosanthes scabra]|uniref:Uncharacterized protein n=1 Tax=Stylosanthes scabra TaxID=79078 RepID=A0ABU6XNF1_9FABA|nr:hypothetical protein [Stylosanthes scabra]
MGRNEVKSVTAIRTPLLARVTSLRHKFTTVITMGLVTAGSTSSFNNRLVDCKLHRHTYIASEFTPVTRIYSNPSWDQYLTVGMPRIRRGLTSPLYPGWCVPPR